MTIVCLDLEGVLVPEIWIEVSRRSGIAALARTTRDEPDYDKLMRGRLALLAEHKLKLADLQAIIAGMGPLPGAREFLDQLRDAYQVVILSDTFYEFASPLMAPCICWWKTWRCPTVWLFLLTSLCSISTIRPTSISAPLMCARTAA